MCCALSSMSSWTLQLLNFSVDYGLASLSAKGKLVAWLGTPILSDEWYCSAG